MTSVSAVVLLCWLALATANLELVDQKENGFSMANFERLMDLRPLGTEFFRHFENISEADLELFEGRLPSQQDLVCLADITQLMQALTSGRLWALSMIDSWGTIPSGYLMGNRIDFGNYDQCIRLDKTITDGHSIQGKYCFLELPVAKWLGFDMEILKVTNMRTAVCLPSSCSAELMETFVGQLLQRLLGVSNANTKFSIDESSCRVAHSKSLDSLTIVTIVLLSVFASVMIICTAYDYLFFGDKTRPPHRLVSVFSARANSRSLFAMVDIESSPNVIHCLHGIRCMSLIWVIYSHEFIIALISPNINQLDALRWMQQAFSSFILYAPFSVDSFFFLSGLLVVMISMRLLDKTKGKINVPMMYLHRYLRLTPLLVVAILVYWKFLPHFADGPLYEQVRFADYSVCKRTWFWTLLYVQNYATKETCVTHTWYLAVDMQLYIISPILLLALYRWGKKAAGGILLLMLLLSSCLFATILIKNYKVLFKNGGMDQDMQRELYSQTHNHAAPWLVGLLFGYFLHLTRGKQFQMSRLIVWVGWLLCLALLFTSIFALYPYAKLLGPSPTVLAQAFYYTLTRIAWPLGLCWVVFACMQGHGGLANSFLSSPLWQPLSRLSYSAYIWHVFIMEVNHRRIRSYSHFTNYDMMLGFWATFGFTMLMSYTFFIVIEAPLAGLESLLLPTRKPNLKPSPQPVVATDAVEAAVEPEVQAEQTDLDVATTTTSKQSV
ncbi:nose resistant to fluoxetine protein 6 [Drosophila guanche]|uniref:Blast:Nose resistant to fluoxetine protein 6 n=1 Tax=Drosophila guanche TaxID=7266 RepID=A0A3B0IZN8_DROGU|nr:nose resistant to fluoxetine protein 6 [Drosophila guanche]SPP73715.1 blast:Nose resistant to fluoxetine protein 6 [Drosophila guanche]